MALLRRTFSSRKVYESKNDHAKKCGIKSLQLVGNISTAEVNGNEWNCKKWMQNSFFNDTHKNPGQSIIEPPVPKNVQNGQDSIKEELDMQEAQEYTSFETKNISTDSGMCTSTPKSKRKRLLKQCVSSPLDQSKQIKYSSPHKSFDESDSLFADLDISAECQQQGATNSPHVGKVQTLGQTEISNPGYKRKVPISNQISGINKRLAQERYNSLTVFEKQNCDKATIDRDIANVERERVIHSGGKVSEPVEDPSVMGDVMAFCDNDLSDFDILFPGSGNKDSTIQQACKESAVDRVMSNNDEDLAGDKSDCDLVAVESSCLSLLRHSDTTSGSAVPPKTPQSTSVSLKERLKQTLQKNAKLATSQARSKLLQQVNLEEIKKEVQMLKDEGSEFDVGPFYGLPSKVKELFESQRGITKLYDWQHECLSLKAVKGGGNLIYSLPTSGGKTLVAEILILRELLCKKRDALLVLPFVSIVQEKVRGLSAFCVELDFLVEEYAGSKGGFPPKKRRNMRSLYIATIEKANSLVNSLIEGGRVDSLGLCVVDELHMLGEGAGRGATLEMFLAKLMHCTENTQIIGMSATLNNIKDLEIFLNAELYTNDFRPVELKEYMKMEDMIYSIHSTALCPDDKLQHSRVITFKYNSEKTKKDPDHLAGLVLEIVPHHSCLVFCPTKKNCENVADLICRLSPRRLTVHKKSEKKELLARLSSDSNGEVCPVLRRTIPYGVAYHHSGLTMDERKSLEEAYSEGTLCVLCCTSTLAAGVNLPAKRVILRSPYVGECFLSRSQYKQMVGRAGRAGIDSSGESILVVQKKDKTKLLDLVSGPCDNCQSSLLYMEGKGMRNLLLTAIGLKVTESRRSVGEFVKRTLCYVQTRDSDLNITKSAETAVEQLIELGLVGEKSVQSDWDSQQCEQSLEVTKLGKAVYKGSIDLERGYQLYSDLCAAREALCVANYLHLLYLVTPYDLVDQVRPNWMVYLDQVSSFNESEQRVASVIGVTESYLSRKASGQRIRKGVDEFVVKRFYLTLILYHLWRQQTVWDVAHKFSMSRGFVQQLLNGAAAFASCVTRFCQELDDFWAYQDLLQNFVKKLSYCVTMELIPLMEIPGVKIGRAKQLYTAGYKSLHQVAHANLEMIVREIEHLPRKAATQIVTAAKMLLQEKVESLREEVDEMMGTFLPDPEVAPIQNHKGVSTDLSQASVTTTWGNLPTSQ